MGIKLHCVFGFLAAVSGRGGDHGALQGAASAPGFRAQRRVPEQTEAEANEPTRSGGGQRGREPAEMNIS